MIRWHWQNLTKDEKGFTLRHGRMWLHVGKWAFHYAWNFWSNFCHLSFALGNDDNPIAFSIALPPVSLFFSITPPWNFQKQYLLKDEREFRIAVHHWAIWLHVWRDPMTWCKADPWYRRGVAFHIDDFFLGKTKYHSEEAKPQEPIEIELDGRTYKGTARFEHARWKRPRWFARNRDYIIVDMHPGEGLPFEGKGTCSWNCGENALCGWGVEGHNMEDAIAEGIRSVLESRRKYGIPSRLKTQVGDHANK